jgi:outer membrane protein OmpA-like peptidoglycan-associated protein
MRLFLVSLAASAVLLAQSTQPKGNWQKPGEIQQPKGNWQKPGDIQVPRGIQAIKVEDQTCQKEFSIAADALFEFDKAVLSADAEQTLTALGPLIQKAGQHPARVEGHTDGIGSDTYNQKLSERRALAVKDWLVAHRYVAGSTPIKGFGKLQPVAPNSNPDGSDNPAGRQQNRRVTVIIDACH